MTVTITIPVTDAVGATASATTTATQSTASAWPDRTNTGYQNATGTLRNWPGGSIQSNTTYNNYNFVGGIDVGSTSASVSNVTFYGCRFASKGTSEAVVLLFGDNITFSYCTFEPSTVSWPISQQVPYASGYQYGLEGNGAYNTHIAQLTVNNCDFWGFANAIDVTGSTQAKPQVYRDNWFHDARNDGGVDHTDGPWCSDRFNGSYVVFDHNVVESVGNTFGLSTQSGVNGSAQTNNFHTITRNRFSGWGYAVNLPSNNDHITFTDNVFSTRLLNTFGPLYTTLGTGSVWRRNTWSVPAGAAWGTPANDGKFWMPVAGASGNDNTFVSTTDYTG
jgi:hypothetical protein